MTLEEFNAMGAGEATTLVRACADIPVWADAVTAGRPYDTLDALLARAAESARWWRHEDVDRALADHPRIGERHEGEGTSAGMSRSEQAGVSDDTVDDGVRRRLADGNRLYEETFDRIFLVRAAGRSAEEMLSILDRRLTNSPEQEAEETTQQLREIALLRLEGQLS